MMPGYCPATPRRSRHRRRTAALCPILLILFVLAGACTPMSREKKRQDHPSSQQDERPSGQEVSEQAAESTKKADIDNLVLYSSSIDEDQDAGADTAADDDEVRAQDEVRDQADAGTLNAADEADAAAVPQEDTEQE